jgi:predicted enzyme involved in methoxymalonyl-ACP biosynthesis
MPKSPSRELTADQLIDPYFYLSEIADRLWDLYQETKGKTSDQARSMYDTLENIYLEPIRRSQIQSNTEAYAALTRKLQDDITAINKDIVRINRIADNTQKVAQYAAIFDQIIGIAAKLLV